VTALLVLLAQEEVIQRADPARTQYLEAAGLCRTAEELIDQNPEGAAQKLTELLDKYGTLPHLERRIRVQVFADDPGSPFNFFPYQFRGRARLTAAKGAKTALELADRTEAAVRDFERSVEKGAEPSRALLRTARIAWWGTLKPLLGRDAFQADAPKSAAKAGALLGELSRTGEKEVVGDAVLWLRTELGVVARRQATLKRGNAADREAAAQDLAWCRMALGILEGLPEGKEARADLERAAAAAREIAGFQGTFQLRIAVAPWARVEQISREGKPMAWQPIETPLLVPLPLERGAYEIKLVHPKYGIRVKTVSAGELGEGKTYLLSGDMEKGEFQLSLSP